VFAAGGWYLFAISSPVRNPSFRVLHDHPEQIVWVYAIENLYNNMPTSVSIQLGRRDGTLGGLIVRYEHKDEALALVVKRAPQAIVGYSKALEQRFRANPSDLQLTSSNADIVPVARTLL
jgi:hypothetical protein